MPCPYDLQEQLADEDDDTVFGGPCAVPTYLSATNYGAVEHQMLDEEGHQANHRVNLVDFTDRKSIVEGLVAPNIGIRNLISGENLTDNSFAQQMHLASAWRPDVVVATYRSAMPVHNALKGYYDALGASAPLLEHVDVSHRHRRSNFDYNTLFVAECNRLRRVVEGARTLVIDQYFNTGRSLFEAGKILTTAGSTAIRGMAGHWYGDVYEQRIGHATYPDATTVRTLHAEFMYHTGLRAAAVPQQTKPEVSTGDIAAKYKLFEVTAHYERFVTEMDM
jgi:hypoxanthine phosphoribosyltransferase